ncbi:hypothetical protein BYT27DRAFT_7344083 [Phlegmacium glaucopus]|nr:hypothetical protein BYT27DRAFT_7344083 [Phlegmacium glaucopus]
MEVVGERGAEVGWGRVEMKLRGNCLLRETTQGGPHGCKTRSKKRIVNGYPKWRKKCCHCCENLKGLFGVSLSERCNLMLCIILQLANTDFEIE